MNRSDLLNIASFATHTRALGPGLRSVIWVQGCPIHCKGCIAPEWIPFKPAMQMSPDEIVEKILFKEMTGLTISGGEPIEQAQGLTQVIHLARQRRDIDVICFTGYRYEQLLKDGRRKEIIEFLKQIDVLIDGPYIASKNEVTGLRGSSNQRIIHLTPRLQAYDFEQREKQVEINIEDGFINLIGIPTAAVMSALDEIRNAQVNRKDV